MKPSQATPDRTETRVAGICFRKNRAPAIRTDGRRTGALRITRAIGAGALLVVGAVHLEQYTVAHFSDIPTIGSLFVVNFVAATSLGLVLLSPMRASARGGRLLFDSMAALAGIGVSAGALAALVISEHTQLFGFMEHGYRLEIVIALIAETIAILALGVFLVLVDRWARGAAGEDRHPRRTQGIQELPE